jgi:hypothetical protein
LQYLDDIYLSAEEKIFDSMNFKIEIFDREAWVRGILKIVLASGHKILGPIWTFGEDAGRLRKVILSPRAVWPTDIRGTIACELGRAFRLVLGKSAHVRDSNQHTISVIPGPNEVGYLAVSLFGGDLVPEAIVEIGRLPKAFTEALNSDQNARVVMGYRVDPMARSATTITFGQMDRRIAESSNRKTLRLLRDFTAKKVPTR